MSRGHGKVQRKILELFDKNRQQVISTFNVAGCVFETAHINASQQSSTRRALRKLEKAGHIKEAGYNRLGRKLYIHPNFKRNMIVPFCMSDLNDRLNKLSQESKPTARKPAI